MYLILSYLLLLHKASSIPHIGNIFENSSSNFHPTPKGQYEGKVGQLDPEDFRHDEVFQLINPTRPSFIGNYSWYDSLDFDLDEPPPRPLIRKMRQIYNARPLKEARKVRREKREAEYYDDEYDDGDSDYLGPEYDDGSEEDGSSLDSRAIGLFSWKRRCRKRWWDKRCTGRRNKRKEILTKIWICGGRTQKTNKPINELEKYDYSNKRGLKCPPMPEGRYGHGTAVIQSLVYTIGGHSPFKRWDPSMDTWDSNKNRWGSAHPMHRPRSFFGVCTDGNTIYVCGGFGPGEDYCEVYDVKMGLWYEFRSYNDRRSFFSLSNRGGFLYSIGGKNRNNVILNDVQIYNPEGMNWYEGPPLLVPRAGHGSAILDNTIYVTGGVSDECCALNSVEVLPPPHYNRWSFARRLAQARAYHGIYRIWGAIVVFGGKTGRWGNHIDGMESYEVKKKVWKRQSWSLSDNLKKSEYYSMCATQASESSGRSIGPFVAFIYSLMFMRIVLWNNFL